MKKLGFGLVLIAIVGCGAFTEDAQAPADVPVPVFHGKTLNVSSSGSTGASNHVVIYRSESIPSDAASKITKAGGKVLSTLPSLGIALVEAPATFDAKMAKDSSVLASAPAHRWQMPTSHSEPSAPPPPDLAYFFQWDIRRVNAPAAWEHVPSLGNASVAVIDSGIMNDHPEFDPGQVVYMKTFADCTGPADREGYPEYSAAILFDVNEVPFACYHGEMLPTDYQDHGTHVAGTIGANRNPDTLTVGVAPGVRLLSYKIGERAIFLDASGFPVRQEWLISDYNVWRAIDDASAKGVSVINMSLGANLNRNDKAQNAHILAWDRVVRAATKRGTLVVAAAGNDNASLNGALTSVPSDLPSVVSVGATGTKTLIGPEGWDALPGSDVRAEYSNFGAAVDISAPGGDCGPPGEACNLPNLILSSIIMPRTPEGFPPGEAVWAWKAGTSMAAPHVAGVAALVRAKHPGLSPAAVKDRLKATAQPIGPRQQFGAGMVDAAAATAN